MKKVVKVVGVVMVVIGIIALLKGEWDEKGRLVENTRSTMEEQYEEIQSLKEQIKEKENKIAELEQQVKTVEDETYMQLKFPSDGNYYKEAYNEVQFYSDATCTIKIDNVRFMSSYVDTSAENGLSIYCLRKDDGKICYCTESPYLITENDYKEYYKPQ